MPPGDAGAIPGHAHTAPALLEQAGTHTQHATSYLSHAWASQETQTIEVLLRYCTRAVPKLFHTALGLCPRAWCNNSGIALVGM